MPLVNVMVNARAYTIACDEGEEGHLKELAAHVDDKVRELVGLVGQVGDQKLMLMAAVLITDELFESRGSVDGHAKKTKELAGAHAGFEVRIAETEKRAAHAVEAAEKHAAEVEAQAARAIADAEKRTAQAIADAEKRIADVEARILEAMRDAEGKGAQASEEAEHLAALELDEAASRLERMVERLKAA